MPERDLILGDWGNSNLRLYRMRGEEPTADWTGPGVLSVSDFDAVLQAGLSALDTSRAAEIWLCGGVGSNIGWAETGYADAPARAEDVAQGIVVHAGVHLIPGVCDRAGPLGSPDTMRGEECQALGWMAMAGRGDGLLCLPGTHAKWVRVADGRIVDVLSGFTGELFAALQTTILVPHDAGEVRYGAAFEDGVRCGREGRLVHALAAIRARQAAGDLRAKEVRSALLGTIAGNDLAGARAVFGRGPDAVIGGEPARAWARALGRAVEVIDGRAAAIAGMLAVRAAFTARGSAN